MPAEKGPEKPCQIMRGAKPNSGRSLLTLLILDLGLHVLNGVRRLHLKRDGLASQRLHKDLQNSQEEVAKVNTPTCC